jgi:hypothetical protein
MATWKLVDQLADFHRRDVNARLRSVSTSGVSRRSAGSFRPSWRESGGDCRVMDKEDSYQEGHLALPEDLLRSIREKVGEG